MAGHEIGRKGLSELRRGTRGHERSSLALVGHRKAREGTAGALAGHRGWSRGPPHEGRRFRGSAASFSVWNHRLGKGWDSVICAGDGALGGRGRGSFKINGTLERYNGVYSAKRVWYSNPYKKSVGP